MSKKLEELTKKVLHQSLVLHRETERMLELTKELRIEAKMQQERSK